MIESTHDVATFDEDDGNIQVLILAGHDVIVPVELDAENDPLQDDWVSLRSVGGAYEAFLQPGMPDVEADVPNRRWYFRFRDVPFGAYRVELLVGEAWTELIPDLVVRREGVFAGGKKLGAAKPTEQVAPAAEVEPAPEPELEDGAAGFAEQQERR